MIQIIVTRFEPFGSWYAQNGISGALLSLLDIGFGLFEVSNSSNLGAEGMNPKYMYYVNLGGDAHARWRACGRAL